MVLWRSLDAFFCGGLCLSPLRCRRSLAPLSLWLGELYLDILFLEVSLGPRFAGGDGSRVQVRLVWLCLVEFLAVVYGSWRLPVLLLHLVSPHHGYRSGFSVRKRWLSSGVLSLCVSRYSLFVDTGWRFHSQVNSLWFSKVANVERFSGVIGRLGVSIWSTITSRCHKSSVDQLW